MESEGAKRPGLIAAPHYSMLVAWWMFRGVPCRTITVMSGETKTLSRHPLSEVALDISFGVPSGIDIAISVTCPPGKMPGNH